MSLFLQISFEGKMSVSKDNFDSQTEIQYQYKYKNQTIVIKELTKLILEDIKPTENVREKVKNATTIILNDYETIN